MSWWLLPVLLTSWFAGAAAPWLDFAGIGWAGPLTRK
jgi:hypothetical protein